MSIDSQFKGEEEELLIEEISKYPMLFNASVQDYRNNVKRDHAWTEIAKILNKNVPACKKRWKAIRDNYMKRKKTTKMSTGSSAVGISRKRNPLFDQLSFLDCVPSERVTLSNTPEEILETPSVTQEDVKNDESYYNANEIKEQPGDDSQDYQEESHEEAVSTPSTRQAKTQTPPKRYKRRITSSISDQILSETRKNVEKKDLLMNELINNSDTAIDTFFKSMAMTVKTFPPLKVAQIKNQIFNIVSKMEISILESQHQSSPTHPS